MPSNSKDVVIRFRGDATNFQNVTKRIVGDLGTMQKRITGLSSTFKLGFATVIGGEIKGFLQGTLRDALKDGSELQKVLGTGGVQAAKQLSESLAGIKLGLQAATLQVLNEFTPALKAAADVGKTIAERISGGLQGPAAQIAAERKASPIDFNRPQDAMDRLLSEKTRLERQRATVFDKSTAEKVTGLLPFGIGGAVGQLRGVEKQNQAELLDARLATINLELGSLEGNLAALNRANTKAAFEAMTKHATRLGDILRDTGQGLLSGAKGLGGNLLDRGRAAVIGFKTDTFEARRSRAAEIIEANRTPAERAREEFQELNRLRFQGAVSPEQFDRARGGLAERLQGMLPQQQQRNFGPAPGLQATEGRFITMGRQQDVGERQVKVLEKNHKELAEIRKLLADIKGKPRDDATGTL